MSLSDILWLCRVWHCCCSCWELNIQYGLFFYITLFVICFRLFVIVCASFVCLFVFTCMYVCFSKSHILHFYIQSSDIELIILKLTDILFILVKFITESIIKIIVTLSINIITNINTNYTNPKINTVKTCMKEPVIFHDS